MVRAGAVALADGAARVVEGPAGDGDAEGDEGLFFEAAGEFLQAVFVVEIARTGSAGASLRDEFDWQTYGSLSKEEGRGASDIFELGVSKTEDVWSSRS